MRSQTNESDQVQLMVQTILNHSITAGRITRRDHLHLTSALLSNRLLSDDRQQINHVLEQIQIGKLKLVD